MSKEDKKPDAKSEEVELVVTQEDYEAGLKRGWTDDDMLKSDSEDGAYPLRPGVDLVLYVRRDVKR